MIEIEVKRTIMYDEWLAYRGNGETLFRSPSLPELLLDIENKYGSVIGIREGDTPGNLTILIREDKVIILGGE